jgi:hypothetical protein
MARRPLNKQNGTIAKLERKLANAAIKSNESKVGRRNSSGKAARRIPRAQSSAREARKYNIGNAKHTEQSIHDAYGHIYGISKNAPPPIIVPGIYQTEVIPCTKAGSYSLTGPATPAEVRAFCVAHAGNSTVAAALYSGTLLTTASAFSMSSLSVINATRVTPEIAKISASRPNTCNLTLTYTDEPQDVKGELIAGCLPSEDIGTATDYEKLKMFPGVQTYRMSDLVGGKLVIPLTKFSQEANEFYNGTAHDVNIPFFCFTGAKASCTITVETVQWNEGKADPAAPSALVGASSAFDDRTESVAVEKVMEMINVTGERSMVLQEQQSNWISTVADMAGRAVNYVTENSGTIAALGKLVIKGML